MEGTDKERRLILSGSEAGHLKRLRVEKRDIGQLRMRTM